ncbi:MAG: BatD family protein [Candidatus Aminicenantes bacterium]
MNMRKRFGLALILFALMAFLPGLLPGQSGRDVEVKASISADKIGTDDVLIYTVTFKGINNPQQPDVSHFKDFKTEQTSRSSEIRIVNGVASYFTNFMFYLVPTKTGKLTLPPVTYQHEGREYKTQSFTVEVVKGSLTPSQPQRTRPRTWPFDRDEDDFFEPFRRRERRPQEIDVKVLPFVSKKKVVKGEQVMFSVRLYTRNRVQGPRPVSNPSIPGFWQEWYPTPKVFDTENKRINGKVYTVAEILKVALFPTKSGAITIPSIKFEMGLADADPFSFFSTTRPIYRSTPELTVNVSPLPPGAQGLPVGQFRFNVTSNKSQVDVNDILTFEIRITGKGNVKTVNVPEIKDSIYYKVYPAKISRDFNFQKDSLTGYVESEVPVSFKKTGLISFSPLEFKYFDPDTSRVVTLKSQPITINVTGQKEKEESARTIPKTEIIKTGEDIDFIKAGRVYNQDENFYNHKYFIVILLVPFLLNLLLLLKVFVFDRFISQSNLLKQKKLINQTIKNLRDTRNYGDISPILENYLKGKTGLGSSEINNHAINKLLGKYGVHEGDIDAFIRIKSQSESSRFSPDKASAASSKELKNDIKRLLEILKRIDSKIK